MPQRIETSSLEICDARRWCPMNAEKPAELADLVSERDKLRAALAELAINHAVEWGPWTGGAVDGNGAVCLVKFGDVTVKVIRLDWDYSAEVQPCTT
jgi:hypothetical protein